MKKKWLIGGVAALVLVGVGGAWMAGVFKRPLPAPTTMADASAAPSKDASGEKGEKDGKKPEPPLEFVAREIVQPTMARLPAVIEFSGPLVAPQTAILRAKAVGTLVELKVAEGHRVTAGQTIGRIDVAEISSRVAERNAMLESARAAL